MNVLLCQNISPQHAGQGAAEGRAKSSIVEPNSQTIDRAPECAIGDDSAVNARNFLPGLYDAGE